MPSAQNGLAEMAHLASAIGCLTPESLDQLFPKNIVHVAHVKAGNSVLDSSQAVASRRLYWIASGYIGIGSYQDRYLEQNLFLGRGGVFGESELALPLEDIQPFRTNYRGAPVSYSAWATAPFTAFIYKVDRDVFGQLNNPVQAVVHSVDETEVHECLSDSTRRDTLLAVLLSASFRNTRSYLQFPPANSRRFDWTTAINTRLTHEEKVTRLRDRFLGLFQKHQEQGLTWRCQGIEKTIFIPAFPRRGDSVLASDLKVLGVDNLSVLLPAHSLQSDNARSGAAKVKATAITNKRLNEILGQVSSTDDGIKIRSEAAHGNSLAQWMAEAQASNSSVHQPLSALFLSFSKGLKMQGDRGKGQGMAAQVYVLSLKC